MEVDNIFQVLLADIPASFEFAKKKDILGCGAGVQKSYILVIEPDLELARFQVGAGQIKVQLGLEVREVAFEAFVEVFFADILDAIFEYVNEDRHEREKEKIEAQIPVAIQLVGLIIRYLRPEARHTRPETRDPVSVDALLFRRFHRDIERTGHEFFEKPVAVIEVLHLGSGLGRIDVLASQAAPILRFGT